MKCDQNVKLFYSYICNLLIKFTYILKVTTNVATILPNFLYYFSEGRAYKLRPLLYRGGVRCDFQMVTKHLFCSLLYTEERMWQTIREQVTRL